MTRTNRLLAVLLVSLFCAAGVFAQTQTSDPRPAATPAVPDVQARSIDLGQLEGVNYLNKFFGLTLSIPKDWVVISAQRRSEFNNEVKKIVRAEDESKKTQLEESINRSSLLLSLTKFPAGEPNNAGFLLIAERNPSAAIKTGVDAVHALKRTMTGTNFNIEFQGDVISEKIGGADFGVISVKNTSQYGVFLQKIYITIKNGYALQIFFTYTNPADVATLDAIVKTIDLN